MCTWFGRKVKVHRVLLLYVRGLATIYYSATQHDKSYVLFWNNWLNGRPTTAGFAVH